MSPSLPEMLNMVPDAPPLELARAIERAEVSLEHQARHGSEQASVNMLQLRMAYLRWAYDPGRRGGKEGVDPGVANDDFAWDETAANSSAACNANADCEPLALDILLELNALLSLRIEEERARVLERDRMLLSQAHDATMGEMIANIAHQWRQPLSTLGLIVQNLRYDSYDEMLDRAALDGYLDRAQLAIDRMVMTIDDFHVFFTRKLADQDIGLLRTIRKCADLMSASLQAHQIELIIKGDEVHVHGRESEFLHVMMNLLANAKDALLEQKVTAGRIEIGLGQKGGEAVLCVRDNAGGIGEALVEKIFDLYFTTKQAGSGIGLYMTRTIIEQHMHGRIRAGNWGEGAQFIIVLPISGSGSANSEA